MPHSSAWRVDKGPAPVCGLLVLSPLQAKDLQSSRKFRNPLYQPVLCWDAIAMLFMLDALPCHAMLCHEPDAFHSSLP